MESLKPLKIIGALALLCLTIFLAIPDGRLNTLQFFYSLASPPYKGLSDPNLFSQKIEPKIPEDRRFLIALNNRLSTSINYSTGQGTEGVFELADAALESNNATKLAIAAQSMSAGIGIKRYLKFPETQKLSDNLTRHSEKTLQVAQAGFKLEPNNAFWPLLIASCQKSLGKDQEAKKSIIQASKCLEYNEHLQDQVDMRLRNTSAPHSAFNVVVVNSSIMLPHLAKNKELLKDFVGNTPPEQNISDRIAALKIGKLICESKEAYITQLVGRSILKIATGINEPDQNKQPSTFTNAQLSQIAASKAISTDGILEGSTAVQATKKEFPDVELFQNIFDRANLLVTLPFVIVIFFLPSTLLTLLASKLAAKPLIRPIRYLFVLPITFFLINNQGISGSFHTQIILILVLCSLPVAYWSYSEKFVPAIHLSLCTIAFIVFFPSESVAKLSLELAFISTLAILAWWQNRKSDHKISKFSPTLFAVIGSAMFGLWVVRSGLSENTFQLHLGMVSALACYVFATAHPEKMEARRQATAWGLIGLTFLIVSCYVSVTTSNTIWTLSKNEKQRTMQLSQTAQDLFKSAQESANNPDQPDVKLKDK